MRLTGLLIAVCAIVLALPCTAYPAGERNDVPANVANAKPSSMLPKSLGERDKVIYVKADRIASWRESDTMRLMLSGSAEVSHGFDRLEGRQFVLWFTEIEEDDEKLGVLEVYGEQFLTLTQNGTVLETFGGTLIRFATSAGLVLNGNKVRSGDISTEDDLLKRADAFRRGEDTATIEGLPEGLLGSLRPNAEEMSFTDLTDTAVVITLHGNARLKGPQLDIIADTIRLRLSFRGGRFSGSRVESIYAEGAVDYTHEADRMIADSLYLESRTDEGLAKNAHLRTFDPERNLPILFSAASFRQVSRNRFELEGRGFATTSVFVKPHYSVRGREIEMVSGPGYHRYRERREMSQNAAGAADAGGAERTSEEPAVPESRVVSSRSNVFYIGNTPVLYIPYFAKDTTTGFFLFKSIETGDTTDLGTYAKVDWNLYDLGILFNDWSELTLHTDVYSNRGTGIGLTFEYETMFRRIGIARVYSISDSADEDDVDLVTEETNRGELLVRHREFLSDELSVDFEIGWLSDRRFLRTFDEDEYDESKDRETLLFIRHARDNRLITALFRPQINDFQNYLERYGVAYHVFGEPITRHPLLWTAHTDLSWLQLRHDVDLDVEDPDSVVRFDTNHEISWPLQLGVLRVDPYIWGDVTAFSKTADGGGATVRGVGAIGFRAATNFYRTYDIYCRLLGIDRLRHIITPNIEYEHLVASDSHDEFIQHDDIDALDDLHRLTLGVRSRLQTYRFRDGRRQPIDFAGVDVDYVAQFKNDIAPNRADDFIELSAQWRLCENIILSSDDNRYNVDTSEIERLDGEIELRYWRPLRFSWEQRYYPSQGLNPQRNISTIDVEYRPLFSRWAVGFETSYDWSGGTDSSGRDTQRLGTEFSLVRYLEDWRIEINVEVNQGRRDESTFAFKIAPPGSSGGTTIFEQSDEGERSRSDSASRNTSRTTTSTSSSSSSSSSSR